jgi:hypothetical protein
VNSFGRSFHLIAQLGRRTLLTLQRHALKDTQAFEAAVVRFDLESSKAPAVMSKDSQQRLDMLGPNNLPNDIEKAVLEAVTKRRRICVIGISH